MKGLNEVLPLWVMVIVCLCLAGCHDEATQHSNRGIALWKQDKYDEAIAEFNKAIEIDPKHAKSYYYRANVYYDCGQYSRAWKDVHEAEDQGYKIDPRFLKILREVSGRQR
jgi:tetratricopeptide (TPR) repeat protein